jgi:geranylgeranyl pyrophosphate synthase
MQDPFPKSFIQAIDKALVDLLPAVGTQPSQIHEAMQYCLKAGGKRLRPVLLLTSANLYKQVLDPMPAAVAIECLHTYSLVHDDLPAMDDSPLRRGQPSAHLKFGEAMAILTGDALLTEAFRLIASHYPQAPERALALIQCLAVAADSQHLIGGQVLDTVGEKKALSAAELDAIHQHKTADLITAALIMGLHLCDAPSSASKLMREIGHCMGHAFQIVDDVLDATSTTESLGKPSGNDQRLHKNTFVSIHGLEASKAAIKDLTERAIAASKQLPDTNPEPLINIIRFLGTRTS